MTTLVWQNSDSRLRFFVLALACAALTTAGAHVQIPLPFTPVPLSLQTFAVLLGAGLVGPRAAVAGQLFYLSAGCLGLPVFASAEFLPSIGYLVAFPLAALAVGLGLRWVSSFAGILAVLSAASLLILSLGTLWLAFFLQTGAAHAMSLGFVPFLPGDALKVLAATLTLHRLSR